MATHIRKLRIDELSLVDNPANAGAAVVLVKRNGATQDSAAETTPRALTVADYATAFVLQGATAEEAVALAKRTYARDANGKFSSGGSTSIAPKSRARDAEAHQKIREHLADARFFRQYGQPQKREDFAFVESRYRQASLSMDIARRTSDPTQRRKYRQQAAQLMREGSRHFRSLGVK